MKKEMRNTANFRATLMIFVISISIFAVIKKFTK